MSFGYSVGDFIQTLQLVQNVTQACRKGPREYREIRAEANALGITLQRLHDDAKDSKSLLNEKGVSMKQDLLEMVGSCQTVLEQFHSMIQKHSILEEGSGNKLKRVWHAYRVGSAEIDTITRKLTFYVGCITAFQQSLEGSTMGRIEQKVDRMYMQMIQQTSSDTPEDEVSSTISIAESVRSRLDNDEDDIWEELKKSLASEDLPTASIAKYKGDIIAYLREKLEEKETDTESSIQLNAQTAKFLWSRLRYGNWIRTNTPENNVQTIDFFQSDWGLFEGRVPCYAIKFGAEVPAFREVNRACCKIKIFPLDSKGKVSPAARLPHAVLSGPSMNGWPSNEWNIRTTLSELHNFCVKTLNCVWNKLPESTEAAKSSPACNFGIVLGYHGSDWGGVHLVLELTSDAEGHSFTDQFKAQAFRANDQSVIRATAGLI